MVVNNNNIQKIPIITKLEGTLNNIKQTTIIQSVDTSIINTEKKIELKNGTYIIFFTYNGIIINYYKDYETAINNYNSIIDEKLNFKVNKIQYNDLDSLDKLIDKFNDMFFLDSNKSIKSSLLNLSINEGYNKLLSSQNLNTIGELEELNKYINKQIPLYISWNNFNPKHMYYMNNFNNNYIINFGPCIFDELVCLNKLLYSFNLEQSIEDHILFYLIMDDFDYNNVLRFCYFNAHILEIYKLKSTNLNIILEEYNLNNEITDTEPIPEFNPNNIINNNYENYINKVLSNKKIYDFSYLNRNKTKTPKIILINIPYAENHNDKQEFKLGKSINKSLDIMLRVYNNFSITNKNNTKIYIKTHSDIGEDNLLNNLLISNSNFNINQLVNESKIILNSKNILTEKINNLGVQDKNKLNNLLCINNHYFYKKSVHSKLLNKVKIKNEINFTYNNLNTVQNISTLNLGYIDALLNDYLIHKDIKNNNQNNILDFNLNERYKNTGTNIYKEYNNISANGFDNLNTNYINNRSDLINNCLQDLFGRDLMNNYNIAAGSSQLAFFYKSFGFTSNKRFTYFRLFKRDNSATENIESNLINCGWLNYNPTNFSATESMLHRYELIQENEINYMIDSIYDEIIFLKNAIYTTVDTSTYSTGKYVLNLDIIDFSNSILNKSYNITDIIDNNNIEFYIKYDIPHINFYKEDGVSIIADRRYEKILSTNIVIEPTSNYDYSLTNFFTIYYINNLSTNLSSNICYIYINFI